MTSSKNRGVINLTRLETPIGQMIACAIEFGDLGVLIPPLISFRFSQITIFAIGLWNR